MIIDDRDEMGLCTSLYDQKKLELSQHRTRAADINSLTYKVVMVVDGLERDVWVAIGAIVKQIIGGE